MSTTFARPIVAPRILGKQPLDENPFIEVTFPVRLLCRLVVATTFFAGLLMGIFGENSAPYREIRLVVFGVWLAISTLPLWCKLPGVGVMHPLFLTSAYLFLKNTIPGLNLAVLGLSDHPFLPGKSPGGLAILHLQTMGLYSLAQLLTIFGFFAGGGIRWSMINFRGKKSVLLAGGLIAFIVGITAFFLLADLSGGLYAHLKNIARGSTAKIWVKDPTYGSIYDTLCKLLVIPPALWMLSSKRPAANPIFWILAIIAVSTGFLAGGRRSGIVTPIVILVACWILKTRKIALGRIGIIWALLFLSIGILGEFRRGNWDKKIRVNLEMFSNTNFATAVQQSWDEIQGRKTGAPIYLILENVPDNVPFLYGVNYLNYVNRFIPRQIWKNKPRGLATQCAETFYGRVDAGAIPMGAVGEAYWSGGIIAVSIVFFLWGRLLASVGMFFVRFRHSAFACLLYFVTLTQLEPSEQGFAQWIYVVAPACIVLLLVGEITPASRRGRF